MYRETMPWTMYLTISLSIITGQGIVFWWWNNDFANFAMVSFNQIIAVWIVYLTAKLWEKAKWN